MTTQDAINAVERMQNELAMVRESYERPNVRIGEVLAVLSAALADARDRLNNIRRTER